MSETNWADGPLYQALVSALPLYVKEPFGENPRLDVHRFSEAICKNRETVYKWLRSGSLHPRNAKAIIALANSPLNVEALKRLGRKPPQVQSFNDFVYA